MAHPEVLHPIMWGKHTHNNTAKKGCIVSKGKTPHIEKSQFTEKGQISTVYNNSSNVGDDHANAM